MWLLGKEEAGCLRIEGDHGRRIEIGEFHSTFDHAHDAPDAGLRAVFGPERSGQGGSVKTAVER